MDEPQISNAIRSQASLYCVNLSLKNYAHLLGQSLCLLLACISLGRLRSWGILWVLARQSTGMDVEDTYKAVANLPLSPLEGDSKIMLPLCGALPLGQKQGLYT